MIVLGSFWAPSWGSFSVILAPWSAQDGPRTVFESFQLRKSDFSKNITFSNVFLINFHPRWRPRRPKIAPRRVLGRLGSLFGHLEFSLRCWIAFGSVLVSFWVPKWCPWGGTKLGVPPTPGDPRWSWDRLGSVLFSSCGSGSLFWSSWAPLGVVFGRLGLLLGSFLAAPGVVLVLLRHFNSLIQPVNSSTRRCNSSTYQLINSSTHGPSTLSYPARRTARCAIK